MKILLGVILLCGSLLLTGCKAQIPVHKQPVIFGKWISQEVKRVESPDSKVDAVVVLRDIGATKATSTIVYLVPHGEKIDEKDNDSAVFDADNVKYLSILWREPKFLEIHYDEARIFDFKNSWCSQEIDNFHYLVEARLFPQKDYSLPFHIRTW